MLNSRDTKTAEYYPLETWDNFKSYSDAPQDTFKGYLKQEQEAYSMGDREIKEPWIFSVEWSLEIEDGGRLKIEDYWYLIKYVFQKNWITFNRTKIILTQWKKTTD